MILAWWMLHLIEDDWSLFLVQVVPPKERGDAIVILSAPSDRMCFKRSYSALAKQPIIPCKPNFANMINSVPPSITGPLMFENHLRTKGPWKNPSVFLGFFALGPWAKPITGKLPNLILVDLQKRGRLMARKVGRNMNMAVVALALLSYFFITIITMYYLLISITDHTSLSASFTCVSSCGVGSKHVVHWCEE